jgi:hypothetical protein
MAITPDDKDWTWVLERPCSSCGYDSQAHDRSSLADLVRVNGAKWTALLGSTADVGERPAPDVWSALEYGCHIRDVHRLFGQRITLMLTSDSPTFANWDQDETAVAERYGEQVPADVSAVITTSSAELAAILDQVGDDQWQRPGLRSNGSQFTVESLTRYGLHDLEHHWFDVSGERA